MTLKDFTALQLQTAVLRGAFCVVIVVLFTCLHVMFYVLAFDKHVQVSSDSSVSRRCFSDCDVDL